MPIRTRRTHGGEPTISGLTWQNSPDVVAGEGTGPHGWLHPGPLHPLPAHIGVMTDVVGEGRGFHPVDHVHVKTFLGPLVDYPRGLNTQPPGVMTHLGGQTTTVSFPLGQGSGDFENWPWVPLPSLAELSDWSVEAFNKFHEQVPTQVSIANFLYELKDMKGMIPSIDRTSLLKTASNNHLAFEFGVKPFISDVKAMVEMSDAVDKRIKHLIDVNGKTTKLSFNRFKKFDEGQALSLSFCRSLQDGITGFPCGDIAHIYFKCISAEVKFHVGASLTQDLSDLTDAMAKMKGLVAAGGFNHPARVVWNAIPYSFVIDWFFHVGKLLDGITVQPFGGQYDITNVGYSVSSEASFIAYQKVMNTVPIFNEMIGTVQANRYTRQPGFPVSSLFLTDGTLSPTQQLLALSMLEQRRR